jgi:hypothetical protein
LNSAFYLCLDNKLIPSDKTLTVHIIRFDFNTKPLGIAYEKLKSEDRVVPAYNNTI